MKSINSNQPCYSPSLVRVFAVQSLGRYGRIDGSEYSDQNAKTDQSLCLAHMQFLF